MLQRNLVVSKTITKDYNNLLKCKLSCLVVSVYHKRNVQNTHRMLISKECNTVFSEKCEYIYAALKIKLNRNGNLPMI